MAKQNQTVNETSAHLTEHDLLRYVAEAYFQKQRCNLVNFYKESDV